MEVTISQLEKLVISLDEEVMEKIPIHPREGICINTAMEKQYQRNQLKRKLIKERFEQGSEDRTLS